MLAKSLQKGLLVAATLLSVLPGFTQVAQAESTPDLFGAIAYSSSTGVYTSATGLSRKEAERGALSSCQRQSRASDCSVPLWFKNAWGALAVGSNGAYGAGWGYDTNYPARGRSIAGRYALQTCQKYGGVNCRVIFTKEARYQVIDHGTVLVPANE
jgi:serine/threonine-protein kinase